MLGVYIHIPFCTRICTYCDFCKMLYNSKYVDKYLDSLQKEIKARYNGETVKTIYIGGGTPSSLSVLELDKLLSIVSIFNLDDDYEYTVECNIESIDIDKINLFKSYGINRISFGVESFDKDIQKVLGRSHDEDMIFDNIYMTKKYFKNINIDLIYGVNDNIEIVKSDIAKFLELGISHISCYSLILEEHTKLFIDKHDYIDEGIDSEMYKYIKDTLKNSVKIAGETGIFIKGGQKIANGIKIINKCSDVCQLCTSGIDKCISMTQIASEQISSLSFFEKIFTNNLEVSKNFITKASNYAEKFSSMASIANKHIEGAKIITVNGLKWTIAGCFTGIGLGGYFTHKFCEDLLDEFVEYYKKNAEKMSNSYEYAVNYFKYLCSK